MKGYVDGWMGVCVYGWMDGWKDGGGDCGGGDCSTSVTILWLRSYQVWPARQLSDTLVSKMVFLSITQGHPLTIPVEFLPCLRNGHYLLNSLSIRT